MDRDHGRGNAGFGEFKQPPLNPVVIGLEKRLHPQGFLFSGKIYVSGYRETVADFGEGGRILYFAVRIDDQA